MGSKLDTARRRLERAKALSGGGVLVALSGGKDSLVTLDLCCQHFEHVEAFYMYHVPGIQCVERHVDAAARRHGVKLHKLVHPDMVRLIKQSHLRPHSRQAMSQLKRIKQADVELALGAETGIDWSAWGERAADSFARRLYTRKNDGIREEWRRVYPIWDWLHKEVISYLKLRRIPLPERLGAPEDKVMTGFGLNPRPLAWMKANAPEDYARVLKVFPFAEAMVMRYGIEQARAGAKPKQRRAARTKRAAGAVTVSEVHDAPGEP